MGLKVPLQSAVVSEDRSKAIGRACIDMGQARSHQPRSCCTRPAPTSLAGREPAERKASPRSRRHIPTLVGFACVRPLFAAS